MKKLLINADWFYPAYKAGGPITSLNNLVKKIEDKIKISIISSAYDLGESKILIGVNPNEWQKIYKNTSIKYITKSPKAMHELDMDGYDSIYLNSMFSLKFTIKPLWKARKKKILSKIILAPRGMLQEGALVQKSFKKKLYLLLFRLTGIAKKIHFHATDEEEKKDILKIFPRAKKITVVPNIVNRPLKLLKINTKEKNRLRLVYLSVVSSKKNLKYLLEIFKNIKTNIEFDIYGSIKDKSYWDSFWENINTANNVKAHHRGDVSNHLVTKTLSKYDFFILPTLGENFGHAIYESLASGIPVIISNKTPWRNLELQKAGWDIDLKNKEKFISVINRCIEMDNDEYSEWSQGAFNYAKKYYENNDPTEVYLKMFGADIY